MRTITRRRWLYGGVALAAASAGVVGNGWSGRQPASTGGDRLQASVWERRFDRPDGGEFALSAFKGRPTLVNFWATWCPPCIDELPLIDRFARDHAGNGIQVVGFAIDQPSAVRKFLARAPVSFPIGMAGLEGTELVKQLGNASGGLPFTVMLSADGTVAARKMGKLEPADLAAWQRV